MAVEPTHWHNDLSGGAHNAVLARIVNGGVHFHDGRPAPAIPHQLPVSMDEIVNQVRVLGDLDRVLARRPDSGEPSTVVISGPRGSGKSTVALHWLARNRDAFPDGQLYADLGAWSGEPRSPSDVIADFLAAFNVPGDQIPADLAARQGMLRSLTDGRAIGILLDDVLSPAQVRSVLPGRGRSMVIATGHGAFSSLKAQNATLIDVDPLDDEMAVVLLRQYVGDRIDDAIDEEPERLAELVSLCDRLPVALCVVGALLAESPDLSVAELLDELRADEGGIADLAVGEEPTVTSLLDAVYRRLSAHGQRCYRALGAFPGRGDIPADALRAVTGLTGLAFRNAERELRTMRVVDDPTPGRLVVSGLVRQHAARQTSDEDRSVVLRRLLAWYLAGAVAADSVVLPGRPWRRRFFPDLTVDRMHPGFGKAKEWLETERPMLRDLVAAAHRLGEAATVVRFCVVLWSLYETGGYPDDLLVTNRLGVIDAERLSDDRARVLLLVQMSYGHRRRGEFRRGLEVADEALALALTLDDPEMEALGLETTGRAALDMDDRAGAVELLRRNLALAERLGDDRRIGVALLHLAVASRPDEAVALLDRAIELFRRPNVADERNAAKCRYYQGRALAAAGRPLLARERLTEALEWFRANELAVDAALALDSLGDVAESPAAAAGCYREAIGTFAEKGLLTNEVATGRKLADLT